MSLNYCLYIQQICKTISSVNLPATSCRSEAIVHTCTCAQIQIVYAANNENTIFITGKGAKLECVMVGGKEKKSYVALLCIIKKRRNSHH